MSFLFVAGNESQSVTMQIGKSDTVGMSNKSIVDFLDQCSENNIEFLIQSSLKRWGIQFYSIFTEVLKDNLLFD